MTLGTTTVPFKETLNSSIQDLAVCPRRGFVVRVGSGASKASPALVRVPSSPKALLGIELTNATLVVDHVEDGTTANVNLLMQLMDSCARPYGPALPLAVFSIGNGKSSKLNAHLRLPLSTGQRVALFVAQDAPATFSVSLVGQAMFQYQDSAEHPTVMKSLLSMIKNDGIVAAVESPAPARKEKVATEEAPLQRKSSSSLSSKSAASTVLSRRESSSASQQKDATVTRKRSRSSSHLRDEDESIPELVPAFVQGGDDES